MVAIAENARIPVDNPATHLELTMVHEAMVLEYSGRHLALIELAAALKLLLYISLIACVFVPWGIAPPDAGCDLLCHRRCRLSRQACGRRVSARGVRDLHRQDARVPRAGIPRRGADARPAGDAAAASFRGASEMRGLAFDIAHLLAGSLVLVSFMQLYQDRLYRAAQYLRAARAACWRFRSLGRPLSRMRRISTSPR